MDRPPHLVIDLNEEPSPPPSPSPEAAAPPSPPRELALSIFPPPARPPPPQLPPLLDNQLLLAYEAREMALRFHLMDALRATAARALASADVRAPPGEQPPAQHPGEAGWGQPPLTCASCGGAEMPGATIVCDACERGFHMSCVRVWPPLQPPPPPPPPGPPGVRRPPVASNEDWVCPECEMRGARTKRWRLGQVPLDINAAPPEDPVPDPVPVSDSRQFSQLPFKHLLMIASYLIFGLDSSDKWFVVYECWYCKMASVLYTNSVGWCLNLAMLHTYICVSYATQHINLVSPLHISAVVDC